MTKYNAFVALWVLLCLGASQAQDSEIHAAARAGDLGTVRAILTDYPETVDATDERGSTPLHLASSGGHRAVTELLLDGGADVNGADGRGFTPLHRAVLGGHRELVELLVSASADIDQEQPAIGMAAVALAFNDECQGKSQLTRLLVSLGAEFDANAMTLGGRASYLDLAVVFGNTDMVQFLIERGVDVDRDTGGQYPPLANAASRGHSEVVRLLLDAGADASITDGDGNPPLRWAVERGRSDIVDMLVHGGADVQFTDSQSGKGLLHLAAVNGYLDVANVLAAQAVEVNGADVAGRTPLYYAAKYGHKRMADLLVAHGAHKPADLEDRFGMSPHLTRPIREGEAASWYLNHRGWAIRTMNHMLVFDTEGFGVTIPAEPSLANGFVTSEQIEHLNVLGLYTAYHGEIGEPGESIHRIEDSLPNVTYVHNAGDRWRWPGNTVYLSPGDETTIGEVRIATVAVTKTMTSLGYLVEVDGLNIFYAGFQAEDLDEYRSELAALAQRTEGIDMAFLPMAEPDEEDSAFKAFVEQFDPKAIFVLDPDRREHLFPEMAQKVREWGFDSTVYSAENPGDVFVYRSR